MSVFNKNRFSFIYTLLIIFQLVFLFSSCSNSNLPTAENDGILVTGSATIQSSPDLATLRVGVQSFDKNVEQAVYGVLDAVTIGDLAVQTLSMQPDVTTIYTSRDVAAV